MGIRSNKKNTLPDEKQRNTKFKYAKLAFNKLPAEKREKVIRACIEEFAEEGFDTASTNRIAQKAGIAKGSIFKYFGTKEKMFYTVVEYMLAEYLPAVKERLPRLPDDLLERYLLFIEETIDYLGGDLKMFRAFSRITLERGEMMHKMRKMMEPLLEPLTKEFLLGVDVSKLAVPLNDFVRFFNWIDSAIDMEIYAAINEKTTAEDLKKMYRERINLVARIMKNGIYKH